MCVCVCFFRWWEPHKLRMLQQLMGAPACVVNGRPASVGARVSGINCSLVLHSLIYTRYAILANHIRACLRFDNLWILHTKVRVQQNTNNKAPFFPVGTRAVVVDVVDAQLSDIFFSHSSAGMFRIVNVAIWSITCHPTTAADQHPHPHVQQQQQQQQNY